MNTVVTSNYSKLKLSLFLMPLSMLLAVVLFLYYNDALSVHNYIEVQKNWFFYLNGVLSKFPALEYNLTQLGDALIFLSFLSIFVIYAPKIWECLLTALLISPLFSCLLKKIFAVPRPAAVLDKSCFSVVGKTLTGCNSLPSGHSITIGAVLGILYYAYVPKKMEFKILWTFFMVCIGLMLVFTRVGVGAHYPLDTLIGGVLGYTSGIIGIFITRKYKLWAWMNNEKFYPIFILLFLVCSICLVERIMDENLVIYYFALASLLVSFYKISVVYAKKKLETRTFRSVA